MNKIEIKNRWTGEVKFTSTKTTYKEACEDNKANLREANLRGANLMNAKFYGKGGTAKIKQSQVSDLLKALGIIVE